MSEESNEKVTYSHVLSIKFQPSGKMYYFGTNQTGFEINQTVVLETIRGLELGTVCNVEQPIESVNIVTELKPVIRVATDEDINMSLENKELAKESLVKCQQAIEKLKLDMHLVECEYTLDRSKVIFVYVADERVDFRELLKELAAMLKCRIELRQIGTRDKAKLVGGLGMCGMPTCCSRFLNEFEGISINMAKNQMLALNIQKLSGQCGKLMCCLKYEDDNYKEMKKDFPKINSKIQYENEEYRLTSLNLITNQAKIENKEKILFIDANLVKKKNG